MMKLLLLGGSRYLIPAIQAAHELGVYVITADYLPDNAAHAFADEYCNVSVIDKEAVLKAAATLHVDGIMSFATDPGVVSAAYAAEKLGLPTSPYESVSILQNKGRFRQFLRNNRFNTPYAQSYADIAEALRELDNFRYPVIVKPVDSAGSKGVNRIESPRELPAAAKAALAYSSSGNFIIEEFVEKRGYSSDTDSFSIDGELVFCSFNDQWFDESSVNPYTPAGFIWPSSMAAEHQQTLRTELQRLMHLLHLGTSIYNIETRVGTDGKPYIMECSPRAGGNRLAEMLKLATGQDLITASVEGALGMPITGLAADPEYNRGCWGEIILHSNQDGVFKGLSIDREYQERYIHQLDLWVKPGDQIHRFTGANMTIGTVVLNCTDREELERAMRMAGNAIRIDSGV